MAAALLAVLVLMLTAASPATPAQARGASSGVRAAAVIHPDTANPNLYINRSQSSGTYVNEYVSLNNSSTLTKVPYSSTSAHGCRWVTVENLTTAASPASIFHNVEYANVTEANGSGTIVAHQWTTGFDACTGTPTWINYVYWTFSVYDFTSSGLGKNTTVTVGTFSKWPGMTTAPGAVTATIGPGNTARFIIATNLTAFTVTFTTPVNASTTCDTTGQICSYTQWSFVSASDTSNVSKSSSIVFSTASGLRVSAAYENWTVGYSSATVQDNTGIGGFFASASSGFTTYVLNLWYLWLLVLLVLIAVVAISKRGGRRR